MTIVLAIIGVAVVVAVFVAIVVVRRKEPDTLGSFQRQIDALSPEARRPVVDQVHRIERADEESAAGTTTAEPDPGSTGGADGATEADPLPPTGTGTDTSDEHSDGDERGT